MGTSEQSGRSSGLGYFFAILACTHATGLVYSLGSRWLDVGRAVQLDYAGWLTLYIVAALGTTPKHRAFGQLPRAASLLAGAFFVLALTSIAWSLEPAITLRRSVGLGGTMLIAYWLSQTVAPSRLLRAVSTSSLVIAVASLIFLVLGLPGAGDPEHGSLRGVLEHKNSLGMAMAVGMLATALMISISKTGRRRNFLVLGPICAALALSESGTGLVLSTLGLILIVVRHVTNKLPNQVASAFRVTALAGFVAAFGLWLNASDLLAAIGEDPTLTGRTGIWSEASEAYASRPWSGFGYGAFWESVRGVRVSVRLGFPVVNAHNGFMENALGLGAAGLGLVAAMFLVVFRIIHREKVAGLDSDAAVRQFAVGVVFFSAMTESGLLNANSLTTILLLYALLRPIVSAIPLTQSISRAGEPDVGAGGDARRDQEPHPPRGGIGSVGLLP